MPAQIQPRTLGRAYTMAISNETPGLRAEILVDGRPLPEYEDDEAELNTVTTYIEASSDKEFALRWDFAHPFPEQYGVEMRVSIDGADYRINIKEADKLYKRGGHTKTGVGHKKRSQCFRRNYRFTALNIGQAQMLTQITYTLISM